MGGRPVNIVEGVAYGLPVTESEFGEPMTPTDGPGEPVIIVSDGGLPVKFINDDMSDYTFGITPAMAIPLSTSLADLFQLSNGTTAVASDNDPIGFATDTSANGYDFIQATAGSRPLYQTPDIGATFDGTDDYLSYAGVISDTIGSLCILFQTGATLFNSRGLQVLFSSADEGTTNNWFEVGITALGQIYVESNAGGTKHTVVTSTILQQSTDYYLVVVWDDTDYWLSLNGTEQNPLIVENEGTRAWLNDVSGADNLVIGGTVTSAGLVRPFQGVIRQVEFYAEDIAA